MRNHLRVVGLESTMLSLGFLFLQLNCLTKSPNSQAPGVWNSDELTLWLNLE